MTFEFSLGDIDPRIEEWLQDGRKSVSQLYEGNSDEGRFRLTCVLGYAQQLRADTLGKAQYGLDPRRKGQVVLMTAEVALLEALQYQVVAAGQIGYCVLSVREFPVFSTAQMRGVMKEHVFFDGCVQQIEKSIDAMGGVMRSEAERRKLLVEHKKAYATSVKEVCLKLLMLERLSQGKAKVVYGQERQEHQGLLEKLLQ